MHKYAKIEVRYCERLRNGNVIPPHPDCAEMIHRLMGKDGPIKSEEPSASSLIVPCSDA